MDIPFKTRTDPRQLIIEEESSIQLSKEVNRDEYPIIWYEPDIDSEEKRTFKALIQENSEIGLFLKFEEVFKAAQSLGNFLLITSTEVDEEKLLQGLKALKDTHGRRYFDFEEEAVLKSLFKEISEEKIKSLKVYVFCTRESFLNEVPANEKEEEVMIMRDIQEMTEQFREEYTIFWCDPDFCPEMKKILINKLDIEEKNIFTDFDDLLKNLANYSDLPYHLILSGQTKIGMIINKIGDFKDLLCIYIYDCPPLVVDWKTARKIKTEKTLEGLIPRIIEGVRTNLKYRNTFPAFSTQFDGWDKSYINKVHYFLKGFINFSNRRQAKGDFINLAKRIYQSQRLLEFEREYDEYDKEKILKWYAAQSPIYKLVNNCLRIATSDSITYCRFILKDLETAIREEYQQQSKKFHGVVYRGAYLSKTEFEKLKRNIGKEIEMSGFLSTSINKNIAENFVYGDLKSKVFITIIIPPLPLPEIDEQGFTNLSKFSEFPEEEILFNVRSRFQVLEVGSIPLGKNNKECRHLVLLYGVQLLRRYLTTEIPTISLNFELPSEFECISCSSKENLFAYVEEPEKTQLICRGCLFSNNFVSKSTFFLPIDEKIKLSQEKKAKIEVQGRMLDFGVEAKLTYAKTYKCHQCFKFSEYCCRWINLKNGNIILNCLECLKETQENKANSLLLSEGSIHIFWNNKQEKWEEIEMNLKANAFKDFKVLYVAKIFKKVQDDRKCQEFCRMVLQNSVRKIGRERMKVVSYRKLGESSGNIGDLQKALQYFLKAVEILQLIYGESHSETAISYNGLASVYESLGEHKKAVRYHLKALEIGKSTYGEEHPKTAVSYNNLATVFHSLGEYQKALKYHLQFLEIGKSTYGEVHPRTAVSYNNLATVFRSMGEYQKALQYHIKALDIQRSIYGESHPATAASYNNLALVYDTLGEYQKALESYMEALAIQKSLYDESHPNTALSYNGLAEVYGSLGEYKKALEYHLKALEIQESLYGKSHPDVAISYNGLALIYYSLDEHQKAIEYASKAIEVLQPIYGESHPATATSYNNLASVYSSLGEDKKALEYHLKVLEIRKSIFGEAHPETAASYGHLASVHRSLGEHQKALEYHLQALEIRKSIYGEAHPATADSYGGLASVYDNLGEYKKALENYRKALEIQKSIFGEAHPQTATSFDCLASVYRSFGEYQNALEYYWKALEIKKSIYGEFHSATASSYNSLALVFYSLGEHKKAIEYHLKALEIQKPIYGEVHSAIAASYNNLASVYKSLGENQKALEYYMIALEIQKSIFGESHPHTAISYDNLATVFHSLGEYKNALEYHLKALEIQKLFYGESHPEKAISYENLASLYKSLGEGKKALEYFLKALEIHKVIFEEFHPHIARSYHNIAFVYYSLSEYQNAREYYWKALEVQTCIYGESHPDIANSENGLAAVFYRLGESQKALEHHMKALDIHKFIYGDSHPKTVASYNSLAFVYENVGESQNALEYYWKALEAQKSIYGESHLQILDSNNNLASVFVGLGENQKALEYLLKSLEIIKINYGETHSVTAGSYFHLALVYHSFGEYHKALEYHMKALEIRRSIYGEAHPETVVSYENLALAFNSLQEDQQALESLNVSDIKPLISKAKNLLSCNSLVFTDSSKKSIPVSETNSDERNHLPPSRQDDEGKFESSAKNHSNQ